MKSADFVISDAMARPNSRKVFYSARHTAAKAFSNSREIHSTDVTQKAHDQKRNAEVIFFSNRVRVKQMSFEVVANRKCAVFFIFSHFFFFFNFFCSHIIPFSVSYPPLPPSLFRYIIQNYFQI